MHIVQLVDDSLVAHESDTLTAAYLGQPCSHGLDDLRRLELVEFEHDRANDHEAEANHNREKPDKQIVIFPFFGQFADIIVEEVFLVD